MRIAIFHNYMDNIGGAEKVGLTLSKEFHADIYSTNVDQKMVKRMGFTRQTKSIGKVPIHAPWKQQCSLLRFAVFRQKKYDCYIIDGDWAMSGALRNRPCIWYVHSPIREIWDLYKYTRENTVKPHTRYLFDLWVFVNRILNRFFVKRVDTLICNSKHVQKRIKKYLHRDARVIHPPVPTEKFRFLESGDFWLSVNRLTPHKRIELQLEAFRELPQERLVIVGSFEQAKHFLEYKKKLESITPDNVQIISHVNEKELQRLYGTCKGFLTTSKDEDFGMTPIEAMAAGKPVIAPYEGGYKETIIHERTGILLKNISTEHIVSAIKEISKDPLKYRSACESQAKKFDTSIFIKKMDEEIQRLTRKQHS
ncbi:MAG: glycosyltransferase [Nanoarchaeota archaeon]|nr:glycosyltransferase [Nanoarchaeota archaeon]